MDKIAEQHYNRLYASLLAQYTAGSAAKWILDHTTYGGYPFTFKDHEYQEHILSDPSQESNTQKCSQVGLSEANARRALALLSIFSPYTIAYTLPTAKFASLFMQTRVQPVIDGSETLSAAVSKSTDNNEVKRFGESFLFLKGAASSNAPISIPCDHLIHDEVDFCDQMILSQYLSRLTHSKHQRIDRISTPTLPDYGINKFFKASRRYYNLCKCYHCNEQFVPDYYKHVRVPGFSGDLTQLTKENIIRTRYKEAYVACPACKLPVDLGPEHREWVCENPGDPYVAVGKQVTPFDAPKAVTPAQLVKKSTEYERVQDFVNFSLGLPMEDHEATISVEDFEGKFVTGYADKRGCVMGVDVGNTYYVVISKVLADGSTPVLHKERIPMETARKRLLELRKEYGVTATVIDSGPHAETVMWLQSMDPNCYASVFTKVKGVLTYSVRERNDDERKGTEFIRQLDVNRNRALDAYMEHIRQGKLTGLLSPETETYIKQHTSMKRVRNFDDDTGELHYSWQKTDGDDHYHHAGLYCFLAAKVRGVGRYRVALPVGKVWVLTPKPQDGRR